MSVLTLLPRPQALGLPLAVIMACARVTPGGELMADASARLDGRGAVPATADTGAPVVEPQHQLEKTTWQAIADRLCCEERRHAQWRDGAVAWPEYRIDQRSEGVVVVLAGSDGSGRALLPPGLVDALWRARTSDPAVSLPEGRLQFADVAGGTLIAGQHGEWDGELVFFSKEGVREVVGGHDHRVVGLVATGERAAVSMQVVPGNVEIVCLERPEHGFWHETARFREIGMTAVLGPDALGDAILVKAGGVIASVDCTSGLSEVARIPIGAMVKRAREDALAGCEALPPNAELTSTRRFRDGTIALAARHFVALIDPKDAGPERVSFYARDGSCAFDRPVPSGTFTHE